MTVLAYVKLNTHQIQLFIDDILGRDDHLTKVYDSVNGHDVDEEQLTNPGEHLWPLNFRRQFQLLPSFSNKHHGNID